MKKVQKVFYWFCLPFCWYIPSIGEIKEIVTNDAAINQSGSSDFGKVIHLGDS